MGRSPSFPPRQTTVIARVRKTTRGGEIPPNRTKKQRVAAKGKLLRMLPIFIKWTHSLTFRSRWVRLFSFLCAFLRGRFFIRFQRLSVPFEIFLSPVLGGCLPCSVAPSRLRKEINVQIETNLVARTENGRKENL